MRLESMFMAAFEMPLQLVDDIGSKHFQNTNGMVVVGVGEAAALRSTEILACLRGIGKAEETE